MVTIFRYLCQKSKTGRYFDINTITIGELSQASRPVFNIVYCNNSLITFQDNIPIKYEASETRSAMGVLGSLVENDHTVAEVGLLAI
jgi:uncharacterized protein GlcG (DUF336 family)